MVAKVILFSIRWENRFTVALGGVLLFMGIMMLSVFVLAFFSLGDLGIFESEKFRLLFLLGLVSIGLLDLLSGIILRRR